MPSPRIVAVDLAINPNNLGIVMVDEHRISRIRIDPQARPLCDFHKHWRTPEQCAQRAADASKELCSIILAKEPDIVVIDGAQGLARSGYSRRKAEAILRTSGMTGNTIGRVEKGFSWPALVHLSLGVFNLLEDAGYFRDNEPHDVPDLMNNRWALEVFPDACWHAFGCDNETQDALERLEISNGIQFPGKGELTEHELDGLVGALTALTALKKDAVRVGLPFRWDEGKCPREGYIYIPNPGRLWTSTKFDTV